MVKNNRYQIKLTVFILILLRKNLEVEQPRLYPGQHKGDDGQQVTKGPLRQQLHTCTQAHTHANHVNSFKFQVNAIARVGTRGSPSTGLPRR